MLILKEDLLAYLKFHHFFTSVKELTFKLAEKQAYFHFILVLVFHLTLGLQLLDIYFVSQLIFLLVHQVFLKLLNSHLKILAYHYFSKETLQHQNF